MSIKKLALPLFMAALLAGCLQSAPEPEPEPVLDENGVEVLPTDEVIGEDDLNA
ncbi:hypothetical protein IV417_14615 [Alphaproteobacteria bacterium KMM 3653]|uniref:Lipoprotein n=1 Tax=Harenicola maris TaxID=2841044 RepID=A0AAP2CRI8_9RHOB|nr:hypothetical protein [Harenicola maris]